MIESIVVPYHFSTSNHNFGEVLYIVASVVPYHFSTSNHNLRPRWRARLLVVPYHFSTSNHNPRCSIIILIMLYLITFLHQTTTLYTSVNTSTGCTLSLFYIKPQRQAIAAALDEGCTLSLFYIKPQPLLVLLSYLYVVPYHFSTSNHNKSYEYYPLVSLYLITFLHQTTTIKPLPFEYLRLYLITFLHQTTTPHASCIKNHTFTKEYTSTNSSIHTRRSRFDAIFCISKNKNNANSEKFQLLGNFRLGTFDLTHKIQNITILLIRNTQNTRISRRRHRSTYPIDMHLHILL